MTSIHWLPSPNRTPGRAGVPVIALVHHRMVGTLRGTDTTFVAATRQASTTFGVGYGCGRTGHPAGVHVHQWVALDDQAWGNGNWDPSGEWDDRWPTTVINARTISVEHHDNGHLPTGDPAKGVVPPDVIEASIALDRLLLSGDVAAWRRAGMHWRSDAAAERIAGELRAIVPGPDTVIDHHYISGRLKPHCWRPWAADTVGFPQARYLEALGAQETDMLALAVVTVTPFSTPRRWVVPAGTTLHGYDPARPGRVIVTRTFATASSARADATVFVTSPVVPRGGPFLRVVDGIYAGLLIVASLVELDPEPPAPAPDCTAAIAADRAKARVTWED
jgi:hypothetical protein